MGVAARRQTVNAAAARPNLQGLIREMASADPIWGEAGIADELPLKLGVRVAPPTVGKYLTDGSRPGPTPDPKQRWVTFVRNHAKAIVACDFCVVVTATFRILSVFVIMEIGTRRIVHKTSQPILRRRGRCSNAGRRCRGEMRTVL